jgi:hypothetical protein
VAVGGTAVVDLGVVLAQQVAAVSGKRPGTTIPSAVMPLNGTASAASADSTYFARVGGRASGRDRPDIVGRRRTPSREAPGISGVMVLDSQPRGGDRPVGR